MTLKAAKDTLTEMNRVLKDAPNDIKMLTVAIEPLAPSSDQGIAYTSLQEQITAAATAVETVHDQMIKVDSADNTIATIKSTAKEKRSDIQKAQLLAAVESAKPQTIQRTSF